MNKIIIKGKPYEDSYEIIGTNTTDDINNKDKQALYNAVSVIASLAEELKLRNYNPRSICFTIKKNNI